MPGAPRRDYALVVALYAGRDRVNTQRQYLVRSGVRDGLTEDIDADYFKALCDTEEEAEAMHNLYQDRLRWARQSAARAPVSEM